MPEDRSLDRGLPWGSPALNTEEQRLTSRRSFLLGSAALLGGGALMALPGVAKAHETEDPPSDIDMLNYALTLEHLEATFYTEGLEVFSKEDLQGNKIFESFGPRVRNQIYANFKRIRNHEQEHVETLISVIESLGGEPVPPCTYNFEDTAFKSVKKFVEVAEFLEDTGVTAYDGAIAHIKAAGLLTAGATIATVEARHASYLRLINRNVPFPDAFDTPVAPRDICEAVQAENGGFIVSCPEPYGPYEDLDELCGLLPTDPTPPS